MSDLAKFLIKAYLRKALAFVAGILLTHGVISADEGGSFVGTYLEPVLAVLILAASAAWTWFYQRYVKAKINAAKKADPGVRDAKLEELTQQELAK